MKRNFKGGIHPPYMKEYTRESIIEDMPVPKRVVIPLIQHIGVPCKPMIAIGDDVKKGQKIGDNTEGISAPVHASISGKVIAIGRFPHPSGREVESIVIESDGKDEWVGNLVERPDYLDLKVEELKDIVFNSGIVGMGGATFPTHVKINPPKDKIISSIILNGAECEPYLTCDYRMMIEHAEDVLAGLRILMKILNVEKGIIGIEDNKPEAVKTFRSRLNGSLNSSIEIVELETKYPQGGEKQLIKAILNKEIPSGKLPLDVGVVVQNVGTAAAIYQAVRYGRPLIERVITVTGDGVKGYKNLRVRIGTIANEVIEYCGGLKGDIGKVIFGGPMMGMAQFTLNVPVVKGTSGILALKKEAIEFNENDACIRCGACVRACPMGLEPNMIAQYAERNLFDEAEKYSPFDCIECGCCSYLCPSKRPLVQLIRNSKAIIQGKRKKVLASGTSGKGEKK